MKNLITKLIGTWLNLVTLIHPRTGGKKGFYIFCTPFAAPLKDHQKKFLDLAEQSTVTSDGLSVRIYRWGTGNKTILFLHGWQSHSFRWKNYIEALSLEEYSIYAFDAPAHGQSGGKYLNIPIYARALEKVLAFLPPVDTAIAHSLGCLALLYYHDQHGKLPVNNLVFMAPPGEATDFIKFLKHVLGLSQRTADEISKAFLTEVGHLPDYFSSAKFAGKLSIPGLIIHDQEDDEAPYAYAVAVQRAWKNSSLHTTSGIGHNLRSAQVVALVTDYIASSYLSREEEKKSIPA